ncbi:hypothetical protein KGP17_15795 [Serratia sp. JSRIV001]|uniref:hypothetical protein n=1 Tax=unclassified Serratia (in: enterobacteria) TaxID=2647522 RepID=UPI001CBE96A3|nr:MULTISPECIES: hypothetical protein [unclassified Serratia (in: enterobacteria)]UAN43941.1 hypothetical protein KGP17_15795 [Serratia sp. JSRIV001]UAN53547.1 hypothetical protein KGP26_11030 [Serratia sp. JSRIV002]UAN58168.1 hypothetical protein KGP21_03535 [Serratia sp. JSRIV004]
MPVRLDRLPGLAPRPVPIRWWRWLGVFPCFLLTGVLATALRGGESVGRQPLLFWLLALGIPSLFWGLLVTVRWLVYVGQHLVADGWDERHWQVLLQQTRQGRRSLQVLAAVLHTAHTDEENPDAQLSALVQNENALLSQPSWQGQAAVRHSRLPQFEGESSEVMTQRLLFSVFTTLAETLAPLADDIPLKLILGSDTALSDEALQQVWQAAWNDADIVHSMSRVDCVGLSGVDDWLDNHIHEEALLVVVALQIHSQQPEMTAESVVGLIFGNRLTQKTLPPLAYLHRPEFATEARLEYGVRQALDWVPISPESLNHVWFSGLDEENIASLSTVMETVAFPVTREQGIYDVGTSLGHPGCVTPWLAIAAATQAAQLTQSPQFIFSGASAPGAGVWNTVVSPYNPSQEMTQ